MSKPVRWGVLSTAGIATRMVNAIQASSNGTVIAVASRSLEKASAWAAKHSVPRAYGSYEELLGDADVDVVYIPLPTSMHKAWCLAAAAAGKHVLCEKPVAASTADLAEMIAACAAAGVQFMDGVMFMHNERTPVMAERLHGATKVQCLLDLRCGAPCGCVVFCHSPVPFPSCVCSRAVHCAASLRASPSCKRIRVTFVQTRCWSLWAAWATLAGVTPTTFPRVCMTLCAVVLCSPSLCCLYVPQ